MSEALPCLSYPGFFATRSGEIFSANGRWVKWKKIALATEKGRGYTHFSAINLDGRRVKVYTHRAVAEAWLGKPPSARAHVRHLNGNRSDNSVENLAWGTAKENAFDKVRHGRHGKKLTDAVVAEILAFPDSVTSIEIGRKYNISDAMAGRIRRRQSWLHVDAKPNSKQN